MQIIRTIAPEGWTLVYEESSNNKNVEITA